MWRICEAMRFSSAWTASRIRAPSLTTTTRGKSAAVSFMILAYPSCAVRIVRLLELLEGTKIMSVTNYLSEIAKPHWPWHGLVDCVALKDLSLHIADLASIRPVSSLSGVGLVLGVASFACHGPCALTTRCKSE